MTAGEPAGASTAQGLGAARSQGHRPRTRGAGHRGAEGSAVRGTGDSRDSERGAGERREKRRHGEQGARCAEQGSVGGEGECAWPSGPRPTWRLQLGRVRAMPAQSATRRVARPPQGRKRQSATRSSSATGAQPRSGPDTPCENSPTKARASLELPASTSLLRTLSLAFLSERPIEFWGVWFWSIKSAPWKTGKILAQN